MRILQGCFNGLQLNCPKASEATLNNVGEIDQYDTTQVKLSGPRLNIKTVLTTYGDFHVKDKKAVRTCYL